MRLRPWVERAIWLLPWFPLTLIFAPRVDAIAAFIGPYTMPMGGELLTKLAIMTLVLVPYFAVVVPAQLWLNRRWPDTMA